MNDKGLFNRLDIGEQGTNVSRTNLFSEFSLNKTGYFLFAMEQHLFNKADNHFSMIN